MGNDTSSKGGKTVKTRPSIKGRSLKNEFTANRSKVKGSTQQKRNIPSFLSIAPPQSDTEYILKGNNLLPTVLERDLF